MHRSRHTVHVQWLQTHCQWYPMADVRTHNSRTDSRRIFKLGGGVDHVTRHVWPLTKVKRSRSQGRATYQFTFAKKDNSCYRMQQCSPRNVTCSSTFELTVAGTAQCETPVVRLRQHSYIMRRSLHHRDGWHNHLTAMLGAASAAADVTFVYRVSMHRHPGWRLCHSALHTVYYM